MKIKLSKAQWELIGKTAGWSSNQYKGKMIETLFPSGMYEIYSDLEKRFLKFDDLDAAKAQIDKEINTVKERDEN